MLVGEENKEHDLTNLGNKMKNWEEHQQSCFEFFMFFQIYIYIYINFF